MRGMPTWGELRALVPDDDVVELLVPPRFDSTVLLGTTRFGDLQGAAQGLGDALGGLLGSAAGGVADDPRVRAALTETALQCRDQAQQGVEAWFATHKHEVVAYGVGAIGLLLLGHVILTTVALSVAFPHRAFRDLRDNLRAS